MASTTPAAGAPAEVATGGESCTVSVECRSLFAATERHDETREGPTRAAACRAAADAVRTSHPCDLVAVDGVFVGWLPNAANDPPPPARLDREVACELELARASSEEAVGRGEGSTDDEALAAATRAACAALGASECSSTGGFHRRVRSRRTNTRVDAEGTHVEAEVEVTLARTTVTSGRGTSLSSRAQACATAYQAACGAAGCGERDTILSLDGAPIELPF